MTIARVQRAREAAYYLQGRVCFYCQFHLKKTKAKADHFYPRALGGTDKRLNIVASCMKCNKLKADMTAEEYMHSEQFERLVEQRTRMKLHRRKRQ